MSDNQPEQRSKAVFEDPEAFHAYMHELNQRLADREVAIEGRAIAALAEVSKDYAINVPWSGPFADAVNNWFTARFADRMKMEMSGGTSVVIIEGAPWRVRFPVSFVFRRIDPFRFIEDFTVPVWSGLGVEGREALATQILELFDDFNHFGSLPTTVIADLRTAEADINSHPVDYGKSRWHSLQAVEKALKSYIGTKGQKSWGHKLVELAEQAEKLGLPTLPRDLVDDAYCTAQHRYNEVPSTLTEAVNAHHASVRLCRLVAEHHPVDSGVF